MNDVNTEELIREFLMENDLPSNYNFKTMYRPEIPGLEKKFGKPFIYFNKDELIESFASFRNNRGTKAGQPRIAPYTASFVASMYRRLWVWYIDTKELIPNPWTKNDMKGQTFLANIEKFSSVGYDPNFIADTIRKIRQSNTDDYADFLELLILLIYDGLETTQEILNVKEEHIDFRRKRIDCVGKTVWLSDRTFDLLLKNHNAQEVHTERRDYCMTQWHGSYLRRPSQKENLDDTSLVYQGNALNRFFTVHIREPLGIDITARKIYMYGFIRYCTKFMSLDELRIVAKAEGTRDDGKKLLELARQYGMNTDNVGAGHIQRRLRKYL